MTTFCTRCVISNRRPIASREYARTPGSEPGRMAFDAEGVCGACRVAERKQATDWEVRAANLRALCERYRRVDGRPDVLVPGSGGKDSVYAAHILRDVYGLRPLTVTWRPHEWTPVGLRNYLTWVNNGFDNILVTPNPRTHRLLTRLAFQNLGHPFQPFVLGQRSLAPRIAQAHGIDLIFFGEDDADFEGEAGWQEKPETPKLEDLHISGVSYAQLITDHGLEPHDLWMYLPPEHTRGLEIRALGSFIRWQPQEAYYFAAKHGFEANEQRTEGTYSRYNSIDDRMDPLHYFMMFTKWGVGRASHDASQEIRNGHLTREEGVALVHQYDGEIRDASVDWYCAYMNLTRDEFWATVSAFERKFPRVS
jgi:N-acetyl sugar amidotransferase